MLANQFAIKHCLYKSILGLTATVFLVACDSQEASTTSNSKAIKLAGKPECRPSTGSAMEDGEVTVCYYHTDSLAQAYATVANTQAASGNGSGYSLMQKVLPNKDLKENFDDKETWIKYTWIDKTHVSITIQMAGGEDTLELVKENNSVKVTTTLSAD